MNSKSCLAMIGLCRRSAYAYRNSFIFPLTLLLVVIISTPSFADKDITNDVNTSTSLAISDSNPFAQNFLMPNDGKSKTEKILNCEAQNKFMDDGVHLYADTNARNDTLTICPDNQWQTVKVEFIDFDVATGDTLFAYNGNLEALRKQEAPLMGKASGNGVSQAYGGWLISSCSPAINPSGCISFVFQTNGDKAKGAGWQAWVSCADKNMVLTAPSIKNPILKCDETSIMQTIGAATVSTACGAISNDSTIVRIANATGKICIDTCLSKNQNMQLTDEFALGSYIVTYKLKSDTSKVATTYFTISAPNLVCNDNVNIPLGSACAVTITPDMVLENPCDTIQDTMYYEIKIKNNGKIIAAGTSKAGNYPTITKDQVDICSNNAYTVEITRIYYDGLTLPYCNNGRQSTSCNTTINLLDNTPPFFTSATAIDTIYACDANLSEDGLLTGRPTAVDNCTAATVRFSNIQEVGNNTACKAARTYLVTWEASDECGNIARRKDTLRVVRPGIDKIVKIPNAVLSCGEDAITDVNNLDKTGVPGLMVGIKKNGVFTATDTLALSTTEYICSYRLRKEDKSIGSDCGTKFFRYWTLIDWCDNSTGIIPIDTQLIEFKDTIAPMIHCSDHTTLAQAEKIGLPAFSCSKNVVLPSPAATDNCDDTPEVKMYTVERLEDGAWWKLGHNLNQVGALEADTFRVGYRAYDACHEQIKEDSCFRYFILEDVTKPSALCQDLLNISMANDFARIRAVDIDAGSWDACGVEKVLVRRATCDNPDEWQGTVNTYVQNRLSNKLNPAGWGEYVDFSCCDINKRIKVELLVIDKNGNYNYCWMEVEPEDKISPFCAKLSDRSDYCDNLHNGELGAITDADNDKQFDNTEWADFEGDLVDLYNEKYGYPLDACVDNLNCQNYTVEQQYQLVDLECGLYKIKRRYRARDLSGNVSSWEEQNINIEYRPNWKVTLPVDWTGTCGDNVPAAEIFIENGFCDLVGYEVQDQEFTVVNDACFKVIRTYHIINSCKHKPGDQPIQLNRISNNHGEVVNARTITSEQYPDASYFTYIQILKVSDSDAPTVEVAAIDACIDGANGCNATKTFSATGSDCNEASSDGLVFNWELFENGTRITSGTGNAFNWIVQPTTDYKVKWKVSDRCGNSTWEERDYNFKDCKKPTPYCLNGLSLELGNSDSVAIWANDFNHNSFDNCTTADKLDLRIWHHSLGTATPTTLEEARNLPKSIYFSCTYLGTQEVQIFVIDEAGNYDYCGTYVQVQDNMGQCNTQTQGQIAGRIYTEMGQAVQEVEVKIENMDNTSMTTSSDGNYTFDLTGNTNYTVAPSKNINMLNGVSTFDLVKITKHILRKELFTSPYQHIAADVNASGSITTFDIIQLRKLILNLTDHFPNNTSWRFIDATYNFGEGDPLKEDFPEQVQVNNLTGTQANMDFIAVKVGDINGSVTANALINATNRNATKSLNIEIEDRLIQAGETVAVTFKASDFANIEGYQFTLAYKDLELLEVEEGLATEANFGFNLQDRGYLTTSWNILTTKALDNKVDLFHLKFKAKTNSNLASLVSINSEFTSAEAYNKEGELLAVNLQSKKTTVLPNTFNLYQNQPNPFTSTTLITFDLPKAAKAELNILDLQGRIIQQQAKDFEAGLQQFEIQAIHLESGTYYYQLVTPFGVETKKMIVVK